jgi:hypothetical protein
MTTTKKRKAPVVGRGLLAVAGLLTLVVCTSVAQAQAAPKTLADSLEAARRQRIALEATLEKSLASGIAERAKNLSMSTEAGALQRLETLLDSAQARLLSQRDRIRALKDVTTATDKAVLVILLRADALPEGEVSAVFMLDGFQQKVLTVTPEKSKSLLAGAADELYRGEVTPQEHKIVVSIAASGLSVSESVTMPMALGEIRYVEFAIKGGKLIPTSWTAKSSGPQ